MEAPPPVVAGIRTCQSSPDELQQGPRNRVRPHGHTREYSHTVPGHRAIAIIAQRVAPNGCWVTWSGGMAREAVTVFRHGCGRRESWRGPPSLSRFRHGRSGVALTARSSGRARVTPAHLRVRALSACYFRISLEHAIVYEKSLSAEQLHTRIHRDSGGRCQNQADDGASRNQPRRCRSRTYGYHRRSTPRAPRHCSRNGSASHFPRLGFRGLCHRR